MNEITHNTFRGQYRKEISLTQLVQLFNYFINRIKVLFIIGVMFVYTLVRELFIERRHIFISLLLISEYYLESVLIICYFVALLVTWI